MSTASVAMHMSKSAATAVSSVLRVPSPAYINRASTSTSSAKACACRRQLHSQTAPSASTSRAKLKLKQMRHLHRSILFHLYPAGAAFATAPASPAKGAHFIPPKPNIQSHLGQAAHGQGGSGPAWSSSHMPPPPPPPNSSANQSQSGHSGHSGSGSSSSGGGSSSSNSHSHQSNSSHSHSHSHSHSNSHTHDSSPLSSATATAAASDASSTSSSNNPNSLTSSTSPDDDTLLATLCTPATPLIDPTDPLMCQVANLYWEMRRLASAHMHNGHSSLPQVPDHLVALADQVWHHYLNVSAKQPGSIQSYTLTMLTETLDLLFVAATGTRAGHGDQQQTKSKSRAVRRPPLRPPVAVYNGASAMQEEATCGTPNPSSPHACPSSVASAYLSRLQYVLDECHDRQLPVPSQVYATVLEHLLPTPPQTSDSAASHSTTHQQPMRAYHFLVSTPSTAAIPPSALFHTFQSLLLANRVNEYFDTYHQHVLPHAHLHLSDKFAGQLLAAVVQAGHPQLAQWAVRRMGHERRWRERVDKVMSKAVRGMYWRGEGLAGHVKQVAVGKQGVETWVREVQDRWAWALAIKPDAEECVPEVDDGHANVKAWIDDMCVRDARALSIGTYLTAIETLLPTHPSEAVDLLYQMHSLTGHAPLPRFLTHLLTVLVDAGHTHLAHSLATSPLVTSTNTSLVNAQVRALLAANDISGAIAAFTNVPHAARDATMYTQVLHALARAGLHEAARHVFFDDLLVYRADLMAKSAAPATVMVTMYTRDTCGSEQNEEDDDNKEAWTVRVRERHVDEVLAHVAQLGGLIDAHLVNAVMAAYARVGSAGKADTWIRNVFGLHSDFVAEGPLQLAPEAPARPAVPDAVSVTTAMLYQLRKRRWRNVVREYDAGIRAGVQQTGWVKVMGVIGLMRCGMWERVAEVVSGMRFADGEQESGWAVAVAMTLHDMCLVGQAGARRGGIVPDQNVVASVVDKLVSQASGDAALAAYLVKPVLVAGCAPQLAQYVLSIPSVTESPLSSRNMVHWLARFAAQAPRLDAATRMAVACKLLQLVPVHFAPNVVADYLYFNDHAGVEQVRTLLDRLPRVVGSELPRQQRQREGAGDGETAVDAYVRAWSRAMEAVHVRSDGSDEDAARMDRMAREAVQAVGGQWKEGGFRGSEASR